MKFKKDIDFVKIFLKNSPQNTLKKYNKVMQFNQIPLSSVPSDETYLNMFFREILQDHLVSYQLNPNQHRQFNFSPSAKVDQRIKYIIKRMEQSNVEITNYVEAEEIISLMTPEDAHEKLQHLLYFQKLLLKQKEKIPGLYEILNLSLIDVVIRKISDGNEYHQKLLKNNFEMNIKSLLTEARQRHKIGDLEVAHQKYQILYHNKDVPDSIRMQALTFLCERGKQKGDINYLENIMQKAKQEGVDTHEKHIMNFIYQITKLKNKNDLY